jgi:mannose-6-phosphate isomerase-like protein (cupin superfamily)
MSAHAEIVSIDDVAASLTQNFRPRDIVTFNGAILKVARLSGECKWHRHERNEELFLCWKGTTIVRMEGGREYALQPGELVVVPAGTEHQSAGDGAYVRHIELPDAAMYPETLNRDDG